jgi:hypothetical protein
MSDEAHSGWAFAAVLIALLLIPAACSVALAYAPEQCPKAKAEGAAP